MFVVCTTFNVNLALYRFSSDCQIIPTIKAGNCVRFKTNYSMQPSHGKVQAQIILKDTIFTQTRDALIPSKHTSQSQ